MKRCVWYDIRTYTIAYVCGLLAVNQFDKYSWYTPATYYSVKNNKNKIIKHIGKQCSSRDGCLKCKYHSNKVNGNVDKCCMMRYMMAVLSYDTNMITKII